jgi:hypothetical protein
LKVPTRNNSIGAEREVETVGKIINSSDLSRASNDLIRGGEVDAILISVSLSEADDDADVRSVVATR